MGKLRAVLLDDDDDGEAATETGLKPRRSFTDTEAAASYYTILKNQASLGRLARDW